MSKTSEQKEGVTTTLSQGFEQAYEGLKKGPSSTTLFWVGGGLAVALIIFLFWWFWTSAESESSKRWAALFGVAFPEQLDGFLENSEYRDTPQARLANLLKARSDLEDGLRGLGGSDAAAAREKVAEATKRYEALARDPNLLPTLKAEALLGAGRGHEALSEYGEAKEYYEKLADDYKDTDLGKEASERLSQLNDKNNQGDLRQLKENFGARTEPRPN